MSQPIELLSILYELSLTNVEHLRPEIKAKNFVNKIISRRSLHAGSVWLIKGSDHSSIKLRKVYATPESPDEDTIDLKVFEKLFNKEDFVITDYSLLNNRKMDGFFVYFNLNDFAILELFYNGSTSIDFSLESFLPFKDVISQFGTSIESGLFYQQLQEEIEQRQSAERSLKNNEEKYRRIIDNIQLGLLEVDTDDIIQHANKPFLELTGYHRDELIGQRASDLLLDEKSKAIVSKQNEARQKGNSGSYELQIKNKQGEKRWAIISGAPNYDNNGNIIGSIGIHLDINEQKQLRLENEFKTSQLQKLFEKSLDGLISINSKGEVFEWSPQAETIFGFTKEEILGKKLSETIVPNIHREGHEKGMKNYLKT
ncbi:MAG: PAS domain S-box protein, partial [Bacteroidota bacterium]